MQEARKKLMLVLQDPKDHPCGQDLVEVHAILDTSFSPSCPAGPGAISVGFPPTERSLPPRGDGRGLFPKP